MNTLTLKQAYRTLDLYHYGQLNCKHKDAHIIIRTHPRNANNSEPNLVATCPFLFRN